MRSVVSHSHSPSNSCSSMEEEEVWNDINLSSLHNHQSFSLSSTADQTVRAAILQDLFSKPSSLSSNPQTTMDSSSFPHPISLCSPPKRPTTSPSLNSESEFRFRFLETRPQVRVNPVVPRSTPGFPALDSPLQNKKKAPQNGDESSDRKHQRLMKNRESAARSRARKQEPPLFESTDFCFYILVTHLRKENARLKKQLTQFYMEGAPAQLSKKRTTLYRTLTAPF
ncbi:Basic-leucine zipper transcription factor [Trema orientale]|uniref:Basic-leucine zipper transcription factor n=1 Tax=Trema orientale TaxID=63057 RepID=A0A2P5F806_TREOI|nr:Basic-leucine zipper transcription factor [Trema orientale]